MKMLIEHVIASNGHLAVLDADSALELNTNSNALIKTLDNSCALQIARLRSEAAARFLDGSFPMILLPVPLPPLLPPSAIALPEPAVALANIDDQFYSLEFDRPFIASYCPPTTENKNQSSNQKKSDNIQSKQLADTKSEDADNLKFLYDVITKYRPEKEKDLKHLVQRLKRSRSKWAHDYRIGQEALYEALEKVLIDLKNYTEHSEPFLQRVSKKDVPDYYDVIKNPMDLGTMTKKLHAFEYMSKDEFAADLLLIWTNCLTFNVIPESIYRKHAFAMKRRSLELLKRVPDIKIIVKPQDTTAESESDDDATHENEKETGGRKNFGSKAARRGSVSSESKSTKKNFSTSITSITEMKAGSSSISNYTNSNGIVARDVSPIIIDFGEDNAIHGLTNVDHGAVLDLHIAAESSNTATAPVTVVSNFTFSTDQVAKVVEDVDEDYTEGASVQVKQYLLVTQDIRKENYNSREHALNTPFGERLVVRGTPEKFSEFEQNYNKFCERNRARQNNIHQQLSEHCDEYFLPEITNLGTCLPNISQHPLKRRSSQDSLSGHIEATPDPHSKINASIAKNTEILRRIKEIYAKLVTKLTNEAQYQPIPFCPSKNQPIKPFSSTGANSLDFCMTGEASDAVWTQCTAKLLAHAGFDGIQQSALSLLSDVGQQYLQNLGRTLKLYIDKNNQLLSPEEIFEHTLQANGIERAEKIDLYIRNDIQRFGSKLFDLKKRLTMMYKTVIESGGLEVDNTIKFEETELDAHIMRRKQKKKKIPIELWNRKAENGFKIKRGDIYKTEESTDSTRSEPDSKWHQISVPDVIGLLKPFYEQRAAANELIDDDENETKQKTISKTKSLVKIAIAGRKKAAAVGEIAKQAKQIDKEALKRKREADKAERAKLKDEKKASKKKQVAAAAAAATITGNNGGPSTSTG
ncbi:Transcriptional activator spt7 [Physocladia obscura]|uniref:Transcriptional activator spt7 n=1 Tax=Physocladia obscura TaxID=109957 RepID=A0AAD5XBJ0_9FUNG|nr:Transcriptional activator spt7 [Physocladia obscura]